MKTSSNHLSSSLTVEVWLVVFYLKFYITRQKLFCCNLRRRFTLSLSHFSCSVVSLPSLALHAQLNHSEGNTDVSLLVKVLDIRKLKYQVRRERRTKWTGGRRESEEMKRRGDSRMKRENERMRESKSQTSLLREISDHFWFPSELRWCYSGEERERGKVPPQIYSQPDFLDSLLVLLLDSLSLYFVETKCLNFSLNVKFETGFFFLFSLFPRS